MDIYVYTNSNVLIVSKVCPGKRILAVYGFQVLLK